MLAEQSFIEKFLEVD